MKNTISKKFVTIIFLPFLLVFGALLIFVTYSVTEYVTNWTEMELKGISEINAADLTGRMHSVQISVLSAASLLDVLETTEGTERELADGIIKSMFENRYVYNAWLACEPNAYDGKDAMHTSDYPGAPSGRFIRSYIKENREIVVAPDMDEETLDDPAISPWYVIPRDTDTLYIDINNEIPNLYDYGLGDEPVYTLSIVAPIHKDGKVIGCVGADVLFDVTTFGIDNTNQAAVAVFYPNGRLFYSQDLAYAEESVDTLQFEQTDIIKEAITTGQTLFLPNEYSIFLNTKAFTYFQPVGDGSGGESLVLYTAKPVSSVYNSMRHIFILIITIAAAVLLLVLTMLYYTTKRITKPLELLTRAADAISQGDLETEIAPFMDANSEIGVLSRSLHGMVEQFRVYILQMEQSQSQMEVFARLDEFVKLKDIEGALNELTEMLHRQFQVTAVTLVYLDGYRARILSQYSAEKGVEVFTNGNYQEFLYHTQISGLLTGKKLLYMNANAMIQTGIDLWNEDTQSVCIVPVWIGDNLSGYVIMENNGKNRMLNVKDEPVMSHVAKTLAEWLEKNAENLTETKEIPLFEQKTSLTEKPVSETVESSMFSNVPGIDAEQAVHAMGGLTDIYEQSVKLLARLLSEIITKLDIYISDDEKMFAIEIHGLKGSLNNIGAYALGDDAAKMEKMAKDGEINGCRSIYPPFRDAIFKLQQDLTAAIGSDENSTAGDTEVLEEMLFKAAEAVANYDALEALDYLRPLSNQVFGSGEETCIKQIVSALEVFDCDKAAEEIEFLRRLLS